MAKKSTRKPRKDYICGTTASEVSNIEIVYDSETDSLRFGNDMINTYSEVSYERKKNEKILSRIPQENGGLHYNQEWALENNYDFICAVDTNTRNIQNKRVSAVGVVVIDSIFVSSKQEIRKAWQFSFPFCFEFVEIKEKPENLGWIAVIEELTKSGMLEGKEQVGLIVDSDLGNIADYNARKKPVFANVFLPKSIKLIYASADAGKENPVNKMIVTADSIASQSLAALEAGEIPFNQNISANPHYERIRTIKPNVVSTGWR